jgi:hypothetical protein
LSGGEIFGTTALGFSAAWGPTNDILTITLGSDTTILSGATLDPLGTATDVIGNIAATSALPITDTVKPTVLTAVSALDPTREGVVHITVTFSELMDVTTPATVTVTGLLITDPYPVVVDVGGYVGNTWTGTFTLVDNNENGMGVINVATAQDLATNVMVLDATKHFHVDTVNPTLITVLWADTDHSTAISGTDTLTLTFSELMNPATLTIADPVALATELNLSGGEIFGTTALGFSAAWGPTNDILTITLGSDTTILSGATLDPVGIATDVIGNVAAASPIAILDTVKPTVLTAVSALDPTREGLVHITVTFSEPMDITVPATVGVTGLAVTDPYPVVVDVGGYVGNTWTGTFT